MDMKSLVTSPSKRFSGRVVTRGVSLFKRVVLAAYFFSPSAGEILEILKTSTEVRRLSYTKGSTMDTLIDRLDGALDSVNAPKLFPKVEKIFRPQPPVVFPNGNPATKLKPRERAVLMKVINRTRSGEKTYQVELSYVRQTDAEPRIEPEDFQIPSGVSYNVHMGTVIKAQLSQRGDFFLTLADALRQNRGETGFTSLRLAGLRSFRIVTEDPGPLSNEPKIADII